MVRKRKAPGAWVLAARRTAARIITLACAGVLLGSFGTDIGPGVARAAPSSGARAVVRAVVARAHLDEAATQQLRARAHLAPLLPQLRASVGQGWQIGYNRGLDGLTVPSVDGDRFNYAVTASWDLSRVLLPREELSLLRELPRRAQLRTQLELRVLGLLGERCRLLRRQAGEQRLAEIELMLDVLSGGHALPDEHEPCPAASAAPPPAHRSGSARAAAADAPPEADPAPEADDGP